MRVAADSILSLAHIRTLGEEAHVVSWKVREEKEVKWGLIGMSSSALRNPLKVGILNSQLGKRLLGLEDATKRNILGTKFQMS